jgi:hypothetical protein
MDEAREPGTGPTRGVIKSPAPWWLVLGPVLPLRLADDRGYSTVTDFARFRGWSTLHPRATAT